MTPNSPCAGATANFVLNGSSILPADSIPSGGANIEQFAVCLGAGNYSLQVQMNNGGCLVHLRAFGSACNRVCTLTQGGYKNHFRSLVTGLTLGNVSYTRAQILSILDNNAIRGNGLLSLAHQLITAKLNVNRGATCPTILNTIAQADALIGNRVVPPVGNGSLPTSTTSSVESALDQFNEGNCPGGSPHCD